MDILFICKDAMENSLITNLVLAMRARKAGMNPAVLFTEEALAAVAGGTFGWSRLLRERETIIGIAAKAKEMDLPLISSRDPRETDMMALIQAAKGEGVSLYACPLWTKLLAVEGRLPSELETVELDGLLDMFGRYEKIIGAL